MKQTITSHDFIDAFRRYDRLDQFGTEALHILFDYLEELEQDTGEEMELDVIAICCDYSHDTWDAVAENYSIDLSEFEEDDLDGKMGTVRDYLQDNTCLVGETNGGFIYACF